MYRMVFSDREGRLYDHPELAAAGLNGPEPVALGDGDLIPLPRGSDLMMLPGRHPVGIDPATGSPIAFPALNGEAVFAAAAFMAPAHTQGHRPAYVTSAEAPALPLFAYTALAFRSGKFYAAGLRVDGDPRQDPWRFDPAAVNRGIEETLGAMPQNRLAQQLEKCARVYNCRAAQNFFLGRYEAPLPTSVACNSRCVGCLSLQQDGSFKAAHDRLTEPPSAEEIAEVALRHIGRVDRSVVSFGQGCEGEPLINSELLQRAIRLIRSETGRGTINLNTNASMPAAFDGLIDAGLDSVRVSLNSPREALYGAYFRPAGYGLDDVKETIARCRRRGIWVSINLLYFPGVTDTPEEARALKKLLETTGADMIQLRNLNIDPEVYVRCLPTGVHKRGAGIGEFMRDLKEEFPHLRFGYFNPPKESFRE